MGWQKWWVETVSTWVLKTATQLFYTHTAITKYLAFFFIRSGGQSGIQSVFVLFFYGFDYFIYDSFWFVSCID